MTAMTAGGNGGEDSETRERSARALFNYFNPEGLNDDVEITDMRHAVDALCDAGLAVVPVPAFEYEIERLRKGLQQIVDGDYPADAINGETWAAEVLADSHAVEWDGAPISRSPLAAQQPLRPES